MSPQNTQNGNDIPLLTEKAARSDIVKALAVEISIALSHLLGAKAGAGFLKRHMVDINVALRVLLHPAQRRKFD
jgi:hypothetical protein